MHSPHFQHGSCAQPFRVECLRYIREFFCIGDLHLLHTLYVLLFVCTNFGSFMVFLLISCLHCSSFGHVSTFSVCSCVTCSHQCVRVCVQLPAFMGLQASSGFYFSKFVEVCFMVHSAVCLGEYSMWV